MGIRGLGIYTGGDNIGWLPCGHGEDQAVIIEPNDTLKCLKCGNVSPRKNHE